MIIKQLKTLEAPAFSKQLVSHIKKEREDSEAGDKRYMSHTAVRSKGMRMARKTEIG